MSTLSSQVIFRQTKNVPGVVAIAIMQNGKILDCDMPELFSRQTVDDSAVVINDLVQGLMMTSGANFERLNLLTRDLNIILLPVAQYTVLLLTEKKLNSAMLNLTLKMVREKLENGEVEFPEQAVAPVAEPAEPAPVAETPPPSQPTPAPPGAEFNQKKDRYLDFLTEFLGPMASVVFEDALAETLATPGDDRSRLEQLKQLLAVEIPDSANRGKFSDLCNQL